MDPQETGPMARRRKDLTRRKDTINDYFDPQSMEFRLDGQQGISDGYKLLLEWLLGAALAAAGRSADPRICALLADLDWWRKYVRKNKPSGYDGPCVTLVGKIGFPIQATGSTKANWITIAIGIPVGSPEQILTDPDYLEKLNELTAELALCFVHEGAHLWQINKYGNDSHPWKRAAPEAPYSKGGDPGIEFEDWPDPVKAAFRELNGGGRDGQAAGNAELMRVKNALASDDYYRPASWDRRGRELVSHLIELAYRWNFSQSFEKVFPLCEALLRDVTGGFQPEPTGS